MEWVEVIGDVVCVVLEVAICAGIWADRGFVKDRRVGGGRSWSPDPPLDADSIARYVSRTSTHDARVERLFLATTANPDPMWDRELDG